MQPRPHIETSQYCWCHPTLVHVSAMGAEVWVHHEPDSEAPPEIIAEAIAASEMIENEAQAQMAMPMVTA